MALGLIVCGCPKVHIIQPRDGWYSSTEDPWKVDSCALNACGFECVSHCANPFLFRLLLFHHSTQKQRHNNHSSLQFGMSEPTYIVSVYILERVGVMCFWCGAATEQQQLERRIHCRSKALTRSAALHSIRYDDLVYGVVKRCLDPACWPTQRANYLTIIQLLFCRFGIYLCGCRFACNRCAYTDEECGVFASSEGETINMWLYILTLKIPLLSNNI